MANYQPADIVNMALAVIGYPRRIGDLLEGSKASQIALDLYGETRDEVLRSGDWPFALRTVTLTLLKSAGSPLYGGGSWSSTYPPPGWLYEYACPSDLILMRYVEPSPTLFPNFNPQPVRFQFYNDSTVINSDGLASRCIVTNVNPALCNYTGQVLDPSTWEPLFLKTVVDSLANKLKLSLSTQPELAAKELPQDVGMTGQLADSRGP